jgi:hypothetical protein
MRTLRLASRVTCVLSIACSQGTRPSLPAAYGDYRKVDATLVFELPDTGGYLMNGRPLDTNRLSPVLHEVFDQRQPHLRAAILIDNRRRPWADVEFLLRKTQAAGVQLFDADRSGWPHPARWDTIPMIGGDSAQ